MKNDCSVEIAAMRTAVLAFQAISLNGLRALIDELDTRALRIAGRNAEWDERFRQPWEALEEVYAVMVDRGMSMPDAALEPVITSAIDKLRAILCANETES